MKFRVLCSIICVIALFQGCSRHVAKAPSSDSTAPTVPSNSTYDQPIQSANLDNDQPGQPEIVRKLEAIDTEAWDLYIQNDMLAARRIFEEALDIITEYEEDGTNVKYPGYVIIKNKILKDFREVLRKEGFEINEADRDILQQEIEILRGMQDAERESDTPPDITLPAGATVSPIPRVMNSRVQKWISRFANGDQRKYFEIWVARSGKYLPMISEIIKQEGMPQELAYIAMVESGFNPTVTSYARAVGMWQFIYGTGKGNGLRIDGFIDERRNPVKATRAAVKHLKDLYFYWNKDWLLALSAYNVSEKRLRQAIKQYKTSDFWKLGWPLPRQTRDYIPKFLAAVEIMKDPQKYGFHPPVPQPFVYDEVAVNRQTSLDVIADAAGVSEAVVRELNSELRIYITPEISPENPEYIVRLPKGKKGQFLYNFAKVPDNELITKLTYTVRRGDTVSEISERFKVSAQQIMLVNNITNPRRLRIGQKLTIPRPSNGFTPAYIEKSIVADNAPIVPSNADERNKIEYIVRKNDTLWDIAQAHEVSARDLQVWNGLSRNRYIYPNQKLVVWMPQSSGLKIGMQDRISSLGSNSMRRTIHVVRRGDNISRIGKIYGIPVKNLLEWNNLSAKSIIYPGDNVFLLPDGEADSGLQDSGIRIEPEDVAVIYIVRRGDTLWDIARDHGTTINAIVWMNKMKGTSLIHPGDRLVIPVSQDKPAVPSYR